MVELHVAARSTRRAREIEGVFLTDMRRLMRVFNIYDLHSEVSRFRHGDGSRPPATELAAVLELAEHWRQRSGGAFSPTTDHLRELWATAAKTDVAPPDSALTEAAALSIQPISHINREAINLNAIAKGWIVDHAVARVVGHRHAPTMVWVSAGGDILHHGPEPITVGIEDPIRPYDNVDPIARVTIQNQALATSGSARRGWTVAGQQHSHVIDPRTGRPAVGVASASVIAPNAVTADVLATILTVMTPGEGVAFVEPMPDVEALWIADDGALTSSSGWPSV